MTLTEQLKQGKLPDNHHYYFQMPNGKYEVGNTFCLELLHWCKGGDKIKVLEEVPSYEQWIMTKNLSERAHLEMYKARGEKVRLEEENQKLKELLKECLYYIGYDTYEFDEKVHKLLTKINQVLGEE